MRCLWSCLVLLLGSPLPAQELELRGLLREREGQALAGARVLAAYPCEGGVPGLRCGGERLATVETVSGAGGSFALRLPAGAPVALVVNDGQWREPRGGAVAGDRVVLEVERAPTRVLEVRGAGPAASLAWRVEGPVSVPLLPVTREADGTLRAPTFGRHRLLLVAGGGDEGGHGVALPVANGRLELPATGDRPAGWRWARALAPDTEDGAWCWLGQDVAGGLALAGEAGVTRAAGTAEQQVAGLASYREVRFVHTQVLLNPGDRDVFTLVQTAVIVDGTAGVAGLAAAEPWYVIARDDEGWVLGPGAEHPGVPLHMGNRAARVRGVVRDAEGAPIAGVVVVVRPALDGAGLPSRRLRGIETATRSAGTFELPVRAVNGAYLLLALAPDGRFAVRRFVVQNGVAEDLSLALADGAAVEGRLVDQAGNPAAGVAVQVWSGDEPAAALSFDVPLRRVWTGADGSFRILGLARGVGHELLAHSALGGVFAGGIEPGGEPLDLELQR